MTRRELIRTILELLKSFDNAIFHDELSEMLSEVSD